MAPFIVFEGLACSGKSTQAKRLAGWFEGCGQQALLNAEPTNGSIGILIRSLIHKREVSQEMIDSAEACFIALATESPSVGRSGGAVIFEKLRKGTHILELERQLLFVLDRIDDVRRVIRPARAEGKIVVQDRYELSTFSHGVVQGIKWKELKAMQGKVLGSFYERPTLTFFVEVDSETALTRLAARGDVAIYDAREAMEQIRLSYVDIISALNGIGYGPIVIVNGEKSEEDVFEEIKRHSRAFLGIG